MANAPTPLMASMNYDSVYKSMVCYSNAQGLVLRLVQTILNLEYLEWIWGDFRPLRMILRMRLKKSKTKPFGNQTRDLTIPNTERCHCATATLLRIVLECRIICGSSA